MRGFARGLIAPPLLALAIGGGLAVPTTANASYGEDGEGAQTRASRVWDQGGETHIPRFRVARAYYGETDADDGEAKPRRRPRAEEGPRRRPKAAERKPKPAAKVQRPARPDLAKRETAKRELAKRDQAKREQAKRAQAKRDQAKRAMAKRDLPRRAAKSKSRVAVAPRRPSTPSWTRRSLSTAGPPRGTNLHGIASYYWQPQKLASGGWFNPDAMTAAHKTLPFGTRVRVTHVASGRSVEVKINDRGPYIAGRIIDLSRAAAGVIGMTKQGIAKVVVEVLGR
jgi:rare lipoprotein A